jgi:hypothetical protein
VDASPPRPWAPDVLHPYPAARSGGSSARLYGHLHPAAVSGHHDHHGCRAGGLIYDAVYLPAGTHTQCGPWAEPAGPSYNGGGLHGTVSFGVRTAPQLYGGLPTSFVGPGFLFRAPGFELHKEIAKLHMSVEINGVTFNMRVEQLVVYTRNRQTRSTSGRPGHSTAPWARSSHSTHRTPCP